MGRSCRYLLGAIASTSKTRNGSIPKGEAKGGLESMESPLMHDERLYGVAAVDAGKWQGMPVPDSPSRHAAASRAQRTQST
jgi:hypothetical protein